MTWKHIVAGIDRSEAGIWAAVVGWQMARKTNAKLDILHVTDDVSALPATLEATVDMKALMDHITEGTREKIRDQMKGSLPDSAMDHLDIVLGKPGWMLPRELRIRRADLLILGGKHHSRMGRWLGGSLAHYSIRASDVPVLIALQPDPIAKRVLAVVDLSETSLPTLEAACRYAETFKAELRVLYVVEPLPSTYPIQLPGLTNAADEAEQTLNDLVDQTNCSIAIETNVREGPSVKTIADEVRDWDADLMVAGSHGKGFVDRVLLGSTTQRLLYSLPCSIMIVPAHREAKKKKGEEAHAAAGASAGD